MKKVDWKDVLIRCGKTFVQAAIPLIISALTAIDFSGSGDTIKSVLIATLLSACATGICAVWNGVLNPLLAGAKEKAVEVEAIEEPKPKAKESKPSTKQKK